MGKERKKETRLPAQQGEKREKDIEKGGWKCGSSGKGLAWQTQGS
jgi:hypothetical protein